MPLKVGKKTELRRLYDSRITVFDIKTYGLTFTRFIDNLQNISEGQSITDHHELHQP